MIYNTNWIRSSGNMRSSKSGNFRSGIWEIQAHDGTDNWFRVPFYPQKGNVCIISIGTIVDLSEDQEVNTLIENGIVDYNGFEIITGFDDDASDYFTLAGISDPTQKIAVNNMVKSLKFYNIWDKFYELTPFLGGFSGCNKKLKYNGTSGNTSTLYNFVSGDYSTDKGLTGNGTDKYIDPLIDLSLSGLSNDNFSIGYYSQTNYATGIPMGISGSGMYMTYGTGLGGGIVSTVASANQPPHSTAVGLVSMTGDSSNVKTYLGDKPYAIRTASSGSLSGTLQIFRYGTGFYFTGSISFYFLAEKLTESEMSILADAVNSMQIKLGRRDISRNVFIGDSITYKEKASTEANSWAGLISTANGGEKVNTGISGTVFESVPGATLGDNNGYDSFLARAIGTKPSKLYILYGLNDLRHNNVGFTASGFETAMITRINQAISAGINPLNITIGSPPYNDPSKFATGASPFDGGSVLRQEQYRDACFNVAQATGIKYADVYQDMLDNGANSLIDGDGIHPNDAGHLRIKNCMLAATTV